MPKKFTVKIIEGPVWTFDVEAENIYKARTLANDMYAEHWNDDSDFLMEKFKCQSYHIMEIEEADTSKITLTDGWCKCTDPKVKEKPWICKDMGQCSCGNFVEHCHCPGCGKLTQLG